MANLLAPRMERRGGGGVNRLLGIIEPAMTVGSAIAAEVPALAVGLGSLNTIEDKQRPLSDAVAAADEVREMLTYNPRSMEGQAGMQSLINSVSQIADTVGLDTAFQVLNEEIIPRVQSTLGEDAARELGSMAMMIPAVRRLSGLPMDTASRMQRAKEMGFDVDNPVYHGSVEKDFEFFDDEKIGLRDEGFFGRGHYFADSKGEANYYGPFVGEYVVKGNLLNLDSPEGMSAVDRNYERKRFIHQMEKLDEIDALDEPQRKGLQAVKDIEKFVDDNVIVSKGQNDDGSTGFYVKVKKPMLTKYEDGSTFQDFVDAPPFGQRGNRFHLDKEDAIEHLKERIINDIQYNRDNTFRQKFPGIENVMFDLSEYIRFGGIGSSELSKKAKAAGYDGIKVYDETVIFDPKNIRKKEAEFDPEKKDSSNLLSSILDQRFRNIA